ncbi:rhomboid domain-containing protein 2 [Antennarius striatus]|uniref:rhomboid domain-containing protein 2 n=1 Tax=Antennarius striatus TaxID=241820 RepID=UPI0035ADBB9F
MVFQLFKSTIPVPTSGVLCVTILSCLLFFINTYADFSPNVFSVGASLFQKGHFHRLLMYSFYHRSLTQLVLNITALVFLGGILEKGFGTVHFLFVFFLLSPIIGFFYSFLDFMLGDDGHSENVGLLSVALACVAVTTIHTKIAKGFICGLTFPIMFLPWLLLVITIFIPHSVLPCNIIAILVGWIYGKGWLSLVDLSEARANALEKMIPFRLLRMISNATFIPASRGKTILPKINPTPGSYPVQAYSPSPSVNTADTTAKFYEGWPIMTSTLPSPTPPLNHDGHGHSFGPNHGHGSEENFSHN